MMKIVLSLLLTTFALCEVPPPYPSRGFRASPVLLPFKNQPQKTYGPPNSSPVFQFIPPVPQTQYGVPPNTKNVESLDFRLRPAFIPGRFGSNGAQNFNSKQVKLQDSYGAPPKLTNGNGREHNVQNNYNIPSTRFSSENIQSHSRIINQQNAPSSFNSPQTAYGAPQRFSQNNPGFFIQQQNVATSFSLPQTAYGAPSRFQDNPGVSNQQQNAGNGFNQPQGTYGAPLRSFQNNANIFNQQNAAKGIQIQQQQQNGPNIFNKPDTSYAVPSISSQSNFESFNQQHNSQKALSGFNRPQTAYGTPNGPTGVNSETKNIEPLEKYRNIDSFRSFESESPTTQYLPVNEAANFKNPANSAVHSSPLKQAMNFRGDFGFSQVQDNQQPSEQYLPVKDSSNFLKGVEWSKNNARDLPSQYLPNNLPPGDNLDIPPPGQLPGNHNQSPFPDLSSSSPSVQPQGNVDIQQVDVRHLYPPLGNDNTNIGQPVNPNPSEQGGSQNAAGDNNAAENDQYLPPSSTVAPSVLKRPTRPARLPTSTTRPTEAAIDDNEEQSTEPVERPGPNVAIATAVAGGPGEQQFYLLQPDGRLQRVVYQKTTQQGDGENEYTADYHFQNIQADPNIVYTPLITLGK